MLVFTGYFVPDHNQIEDPRLQWREKQQQMLKDYLVVANEDLEVCIFVTVKCFVHMNLNNRFG